MIDYLLDTNAVSELVRNPHGALAEQVWQRAPEIGTSIIVLGELRYGLEKRRSPQLIRRVEASLEGMIVVPLEHPAELRYGELRSALATAGTPIGHNDMWIAAHALALDCTLVTANEGEFRRVPGLKVKNWLS